MDDIQSILARMFVDATISSRAVEYLKQLLPFILMSSNNLFAQDVSLKQDLFQKALFVIQFMEAHVLTSMCVYYEVCDFLERLKTDLPESSRLSSRRSLHAHKNLHAHVNFCRFVKKWKRSCSRQILNLVHTAVWQDAGFVTGVI